MPHDDPQRPLVASPLQSVWDVFSENLLPLSLCNGITWDGRSVQLVSVKKLESLRSNHQGRTSNFAQTHVSNVNEKRHCNVDRAAYGRWNASVDARNGTLLCSASQQPGGAPSPPTLHSWPHVRRRCWVRLLKRASLASATASRQRYVPLMCNTPALSGRLSIGISDVESGRESFSKIGGAIASKSTSTMKDEFHRRMM
jgi:hypothetical protein